MFQYKKIWDRLGKKIQLVPKYIYDISILKQLPKYKTISFKFTQRTLINISKYTLIFQSIKTSFF